MFKSKEGISCREVPSGGNRAATTTFSQDALAAVVGRVGHESQEVIAGQSAIARQAEAMMSMMKDFTDNKGNETIAKHL